MLTLLLVAALVIGGILLTVSILSRETPKTVCSEVTDCTLMEPGPLSLSGVVRVTRDDAVTSAYPGSTSVSEETWGCLRDLGYRGTPGDRLEALYVSTSDLRTCNDTRALNGTDHTKPEVRA